MQALCCIDRGDFNTQETGVIAAVAKEEVLFKTGASISECAVLGLEEWVEAFAQHNNVKPHKEVIVCQSNDALGCSEGLVEENAMHGGVCSIAFMN